MPELTLIGYKYLGPGNSLDKGEPVNTADAIAYKHDVRYSQAKNKEDIFSADRDAIQDFHNDFKSNPNFGNALGLIGLGIKHTVESGLNKVIYPQNISGQYAKTQ